MTNSMIWEFETFEREPVWLDADGVREVAVSAGGASTAGWPRLQPGVHDASGGFSGHRVTVDFSVEAPTDAVLRLEFFADRGPCPDLFVTIDGHAGLFHPQVIRRDRTETGEPGPVAGTAVVEVEVPGEWLTAGAHTIGVTTAFDAAAALGETGHAAHDIALAPVETLPQARDNYGAWFGSYIRWSRASLVAAESRKKFVPQPRVEISATPFFVGTDEGLCELVDVDLHWSPASPRPDGLTLIWNGERQTLVPVPEDRDFGMFRQRIAVPEFDQPVWAAVAGTNLERSEHRVTPSRRWTMHLIPHVHLDLGFTDTQGKVLELHCRNVDRALDLMDADSAFRYSVDGSIVVREFEKTRSRAQVARMRAAIENGTLAVNVLTANLLTGIAGLEELFHATDYGLTLPVSSRTGLRYANLTDVPTAASALPTVLAAVGVAGFVGMANHHRAATDSSDEVHLASPVRWRGPDGSEVLAHFADHYSQLRFIAADPQSVGAATNGFGRLLARYEREDYLPVDMPIIGTHADNEDLADGDTEFVERWNAQFAYPRLRVSTFDEYLAAVAPLTDRFPVWSSESGSYWEDGVGSAAAEFTVYRNAQAALPTVETFGAALAVADDRFLANRHALDRAWNDLSIASEHTLTWARATTHPHAPQVDDQFGWKAQHITEAARVVRDETTRHLGRLAEVIGATGPGFLAFNPHPWTLDLEGEIDVAAGVDLIDGEGDLVAMEVLSDCAGMRRCRVVLPTMEPYSYRFFPVTSDPLTVPAGDPEEVGVGVGIGDDSDADEASGPGSQIGGAFSLPASVESPIEVSGWRVRLDPMTHLPRGLYRIDTDRELLDEDAHETLGQVIRTVSAHASTDGTDDLANPADVHAHHRVKIDPIDTRYGTEPDPLTISSPDTRFVGIRRTIDGARLRWEGAGYGIDDLRIDLVLREASGEVDLEVRFTKRARLDMEAIYIAFPFAGTDPRIHYDRQLGWSEPAVDHGSGASNEWGALTNAVVVDRGDGAVVWTSIDAPLFTAQDVVRGSATDRFTARNGHVFSYAMNNFWPCNVPPAQSGPVLLRYRFRDSDGFRPSEDRITAIAARTGAQIALITALDRIDPANPPRFAEGRLVELAADRSTTVMLTQHDDDDFALQVTNLEPSARIATVCIPTGLTASIDGESLDSSDGECRISLSPDGVARIDLTR